MDGPVSLKSPQQSMVRYCFVIGAVFTVCYDIIYLGLRFSILGIKVDNDL
jgi:hypothetical protein